MIIDPARLDAYFYRVLTDLKYGRAPLDEAIRIEVALQVEALGWREMEALRGRLTKAAT